MLHKQAIDAFNEGDAVGLLISMDRTENLGFVFDNRRVLKARGMYEAALVHAWAQANYHLWSLRMLEYLFDYADRQKLLESGDPLPAGETFTLYRGIGGRPPYRKVSGYSWTSELKTAIWFAQRFSSIREDPGVYQTQVQRDEVLFYYNQREEHDFVLRAKKFKRLPWRVSDGNTTNGNAR